MMAERIPTLSTFLHKRRSRKCHGAFAVAATGGSGSTPAPKPLAQAIHDALGGPKQLIFVPGAGHNNALNPTVWRQLDQWLRAALARERAAGSDWETATARSP